MQGELGERRLTNLLHLAELLQNASRQEDSPERLTRWFANQRHRDGQGATEEQTLVLESDQRLVRIVTIHKSKGLEYPIVFIPFLYQGKAFHAEPPLPCHDRETGELLFDLGSKAFDDHKTLAEEERLAEETRLAYVALTRAQHRCYLPWGHIKGVQEGALGRLLHPQGMGNDETLLAELNTLAGGDDTIGVETLNYNYGDTLLNTPYEVHLVKCHRNSLRFKGHIDRNWRITSYSGLIAGSLHPAMGAPSAERLAETGETDTAATDSFPAGIQPGLFLHSLLERIDFPQARGDGLRQEVERQLDLYGLDRIWAGAAERLVANLLDSPLDPDGTLRLRDLTPARRRAEMAFHYPLAGVSPEALDRLLQGLGNYAPEGGRLQFNPARGLMIGFIDLVFEHQGRYYLADYKSNRLDGYGPANLHAAMAAHRYDLQYLIYTVALHRYLGQRLRGYDYERHFGGVYYLFPRGMSPQGGKGAGIFFDRPGFALVEGLDGLFGGNG